MPRVPGRGRIAAGVSTLTLILTILMIQVTAAVPASAADLVVVPGAVPGGVPATVTGSGFEDEPVTLCWDRDDDDYEDDDDDDDDDEDSNCASLGEVVPIAGTFTTQITIPEDADAGHHLIYACQSGDCSSAAIQVLDTDTTMPPEPTTTTVATTTTSRTFRTTTTTPSSSTTTLFGSSNSQPSTSPSSTAGPGTTLVGPTPPPVFGTPTTSLPGITETSDPLAEDQDLNEDQDQEGQFGGADADPPAPNLDSVISGVFTPAPEASPNSELFIGALDGGTPIPEASIGLDPQAQQSSGNRSVSDFPMPDLGVWALWLVVTVGVSAVALTFDAVRQRRSR
ncbi:MAG TPA: hypothetical protein VFV13_04170 [Acidimicrobiia bacterium]|nr:hypothetical protein [Acidimicrobiia bacterium]